MDQNTEELAKKYIAHQEYMREAQRKFYDKNREKVKERSREYAASVKNDAERYRAFLERKRAYNKAYYEKKKTQKNE